jgi:spermidine/putrescine transport system substrate-binding protein
MIEKFTKQTGIKVNVSNYTSNEELLAKIQAGGSGIDVAVPSDYMVTIMTKLGFLDTLDQTKIPNMALVSNEFLKQPFDPENKYSLPYSWTTTGLAIHKDLFKGTIKSWKDVFNNPELKGKISLLDDSREVTAAALKMNGYSVNTTNKDELKTAETTLLKAKSRVKMFTSDTIDPLVNKEVAVAQTYSSDALIAAEKSNGRIEFVLPDEGGTRAMDNVVLFKDSKHKESAYKLLNFMLSPEVNLAFVTTVFGGPVLSATRQQLPEKLKNSTALFPSHEKLSKFENIVDLGEQTSLFDELWTRIKTE